MTEDAIVQSAAPGFPILFVQNELLNTLSKEIFEQQFIWKNVQNKELKDCNKVEKIMKEIPVMPRCPDVLKRMLNVIEIRDERSPKHATAYKSCLSKLERMVKDQWEDWEEKSAKSSIFREKKNF